VAAAASVADGTDRGPGPLSPFGEVSLRAPSATALQTPPTTLPAHPVPPPPRPAAPAAAADALPQDVPPAAATAAAQPGTGGGVVKRGRCPAMPDEPRGAVPDVSTATDAAGVPGTRHPSVAAPADAANAVAVTRERRPAAVRVTGPPGRAAPAMRRRGRRSLERG